MTVLEMFGSAIPQGINTQVSIYQAPFEEIVGIFTVRSSHCFIKASLNKPGTSSVTVFCNYKLRRWSWDSMCINMCFHNMLNIKSIYSFDLRLLFPVNSILYTVFLSVPDSAKPYHNSYPLYPWIFDSYPCYALQHSNSSWRSLLCDWYSCHQSDFPVVKKSTTTKLLNDSDFTSQCHPGAFADSWVIWIFSSSLTFYNAWILACPPPRAFPLLPSPSTAADQHFTSSLWGICLPKPQRAILAPGFHFLRTLCRLLDTMYRQSACELMNSFLSLSTLVPSIKLDKNQFHGFWQYMIARSCNVFNMTAINMQIPWLSDS